MPAETTISQDQNITIITQRVVVHGKTYATSRISSVNVQDLGRGCRPIVGILLVLWGVAAVALLLAITGMDYSATNLLSALMIISILIIPGIFVFRSARRKYGVAIVTSGSAGVTKRYSLPYTRILESDDKDYIQPIVENISQAIALRG